MCSETHNHIITLWRPLTHILPCGLVGLECRHMIVNHLGNVRYMEVFSYLQVGYCLNVPFKLLDPYSSDTVAFIVNVFMNKSV